MHKMNGAVRVVPRLDVNASDLNVCTLIKGRQPLTDNPPSMRCSLCSRSASSTPTLDGWTVDGWMDGGN